MKNKTNQLRALVLILVFVLGLPGLNLAQKKNGKTAAPSVPSFGNVDGVTAKQLKEYLTFIASDELEGRDTPSRGLDIAALYIAQHLASWGIKPAGDNGTYFQRVPLRFTRLEADKATLKIGNTSYVYGKDFLTNLVPGNIVDAPMVFAQNGWVVKSKNVDPYQGISVRDKVVVIAGGLPKGVTNADLQGPDGGTYTSPTLYAQQNGARAVIGIPSFNAMANWENSRFNFAEKGIVQFGPQQTAITIPSLTASPRVVAAMFQGEKATGSSIFSKMVAQEPMESFDIRPARKLSMSSSVRSEEIHTQNVVGILEGSDPVLKSEYVAIGAHYDHVGMNPNAPGDDKIWNGVDDDGSGTVSVLNIAQAFASGAIKPKRSILFIWHAGEEKGLWGSRYFTDNPTVPIGSIITQLNIDMIGRYQRPGDENHAQNKRLPKPGEVFTIGSRMMSTELGDLSDAVNKSYLNLNFNLAYDGPTHPDQFFYRSDHFNYALKGIPIIFYMDGDHEDYHQASDSVEKINFEQMEKVARTIMATGWTLANTAKRPTVDKPLPASVIGN